MTALLGVNRAMVLDMGRAIQIFKKAHPIPRTWTIFAAFAVVLESVFAQVLAGAVYAAAFGLGWWMMHLDVKADELVGVAESRNSGRGDFSGGVLASILKHMTQAGTIALFASFAFAFLAVPSGVDGRWDLVTAFLAAAIGAFNVAILSSRVNRLTQVLDDQLMGSRRSL